MKDQLLEGEEIDDTLVVDLIVSRIQSEFDLIKDEKTTQNLKKIVEREEKIKEDLQLAQSMKGKSFRNTKPIDESGLEK